MDIGLLGAEATRVAQGTLLTKVDDDDLYGPEHVWDLVLARCYSGAAVVGKGAEFDDRIVEIALLGLLVVLLGVTSFLLRRKEREPDEGDPSPDRGGR